MRKLDLIIQTLLLSLALAFIPAGCFIDKGFFVWILILQFLVGICQLFSAIVTTIDKENSSPFRSRAIKTYWGLVVAYFTVTGVLFFVKMETVEIIWFFTAWGIAVYYYVFTWKMVKGNFQRKKFLDILN